MKEKHFDLCFKSSLAFNKLHVEYIKDRICSRFIEVIANVSYDTDGIIHIHAISLYEYELDELEKSIMDTYSPLLNQ